MDGNRGYAGDPEPGWYQGAGRSTNPYDSGVHERPSGAFRLPEQRPTESAYQPPAPYLPPDPVTSTGSHSRDGMDAAAASVRVPVRGPEYPTVRPGGATSLADAPSYQPGAHPVAGGQAPGQQVATAPPPLSQGDPTSVVPTVPTGPRNRGGNSVYRTGRPVSAVVIAGLTGLLLVPALVLLVHATFVADVAVRGVVPAVLLTLGLALTGFGLFALAGGGPTGRDAWQRPPLAYLPVGLVLLVAAGLAVA